MASPLLLLLSCWLLPAVVGMGSDADVIADLARYLVDPPPTWTGSGKNVCSSFEGISCSSSGRVTAIDLAGKGLRGTLPSFLSLSSLTELQSLQLEGNALSGAIPSLRAQSSLVHLSLEGNAYRSLPKDFLHGMPALRHLSMGGLPLRSWPVPYAVFGCPSLTNLSAPNVSITGPFPAAAIAVNVTSLNNLDLSHNRLTGVLRESLGEKMKNLKSIALSNNYFQGPEQSSPT